MGKSAPAAPTPPDPAATAQAQGQANEQTARVQAGLNRVNQVTPYGNLTYSQDQRGQDWVDQQVAAQRAAYKPPDGIWSVDNGFDEAAARSKLAGQNPYQDSWTATQTLSPDEQAQLDASNRAIATYGRAANNQLSMAEQSLSTPFNPDLPAIQSSLDFSQFGLPNAGRDSVEAALNARLQPIQDRERASLDTRLANQGLTYGSEAYRAAQDDFNRGVNDQRLAVTAAGGQEQSRLYNLALGAGQFNNAARGQSLAEQLQLRVQPINEASALLSGQQINLPQWTNVPQVGVGQTDYLGAVGQQQAGQNAAYQGQVSTANANAAGAAGVGAAAISAAAIIA